MSFFFKLNAEFQIYCDYDYFEFNFFFINPIVTEILNKNWCN